MARAKYTQYVESMYRSEFFTDILDAMGARMAALRLGFHAEPVEFDPARFESMGQWYFLYR